MKIDIDKLSEAELADLNRRIVERLRFLDQMRAHASMLEFSVGDHISFEPGGEPTVLGIITRYNKKTVSVLSEDGRKWTVSPQYLRRVKDASKRDSAKEYIDSRETN
jgi:hypothetical protein